MSRSENKELWKKHVSSYRSSNMKAREWCTQNGVSYHTLKSWITKFNKESVLQQNNNEASDTRWVALEGMGKLLNTDSQITVKTGSFSVVIPDRFNPETLTSVLNVLRDHA